MTGEDEVDVSSPKHGHAAPRDCPGPEQCAHPFDGKLESILEALPLGLFVLDRNGSPVYANSRSTTLLGLGPLRGLKPRDLAAAYSTYVAGTNEPYPPEKMPIVKALQGERGFANDLEVRRKEGRIFLEVEAAPVFDVDGTVLFAVAIFRDVTPGRVMEAELSQLVESLESRAVAQEHRLEKAKESPAAVGELMADVAAALREAREDARAARNALSMFLANFSHELRTPLNHIIGFSELIDQKVARGETVGIDSHAENIRKSGSSLLETLNRIIRFAEMDTGAHDAPELEIFGADELLRDLADWAVPLAAQKRNSIQLSIPEPIGSMRSDSSFVEGALRQIVENACKHSRDGAVEILAERLGDGVDARLRVVVSDDGPGISPDLAGRLLDGKLSPGDPLAKGGLGVGIPLAKRLISAVGGSIDAAVSSDGSTFVVEFPVFLRAE